MKNHETGNARRGVRMMQLLFLVVIPGLVWAILIPRNTDASQGASKLEAQLHAIRVAIERYNTRRPETAYDPATALGTFWQGPAGGEGLVPTGYLPEAPGNPLQNGSTTVSAAPGMGTGWVWAEGTPGVSWTLTLFAVDENGDYYDGDGNGLPD